jgi:ribonuclease H2 subunit B
MLSQADGTTGNFRPVDHIFEEAASKLSNGSKTAAIRGDDVMQLATLDCVHDALRRACDSKGDFCALFGCSTPYFTILQDVTEELSVYRFSYLKLMQSISAKVAHLSQPSVFDAYPSLQRQLAKNGLLDEGKDELRQGVLL